MRRKFLANLRRSGMAGALVIVALLVLQSAVFAQQTGQITGTVLDQTGAAVPNARLVLTDQATKTTRSTISNGVGFFSFSAVMPGNYDLKVEAKSFKDWSVTGIHMSPGDKRDIAKVELSTGSTMEVVTVEATATGVDIVSSPEKSATITAADIKRQSTVGRNALELIRLLPGMSVQNFMTNKPAYDPNQQSMWNSPISNYGMNGMMPQTGGVSITTDGAQVLDVGNMGATLATVNMDMVSEVKVQTSNFSADTNRGPVVINAVGKSGTNKYHGAGYFYARNSIMNSNDWLNNANRVKKPEDHYYYPGGNIGGPVKIPGTNLDKKMFFFAGTEIYRQMLPAGDPIFATVPTDGMRHGDFSWASMQSLCAPQMPATVTINGQTVPWAPNLRNDHVWNVGDGPSSCAVPTLWWNVANGGSVTPIVNGQIPSNLIDPAGQAYINFLPHANATPSSSNNFNNYVQVYSQPSNSWQLHPRVDYNFNDSNNLHFTYNLQKQTDLVPRAQWWAPQSAIIYPGDVQTQTASHVASVNYMRVFSPTLTSETVLGMTRVESPTIMTNPQAVSRGSLPFPQVFNNGVEQLPQLSGTGLPNVQMQGGFVNNRWELRKRTYTFAENITKVFATHTLKVGGNFERIMSAQHDQASTNGTMSFESNNTAQTESALARGYAGIISGSSCNTTGAIGKDAKGKEITGPIANPACFNGVANLLFGWPKDFSQDQYPVMRGVYSKTAGLYATDNWKVTRRLTLDLGLRFDYMQPWTDTSGIGAAVFDPALYAEQVTVHADRSVSSTVQYPGMRWHAMDPSVPVAGTDPHTGFFSPRLGIAYDMFGTGKWVLRGGWGSYYFQNNARTGPLLPGRGQHSYQSGPPAGGWTFATIRSMAAQPQLFSDISADFITPNAKTPRTDNWNFTISHQTLWNSFLEVSYVGNRTEHALLGDKNSDINLIPVGAFYNQPWPTFSWAQWANTDQMSWWTQLKDVFRPYGWYNNLRTNNNNGWANYHSLQVSWNRSKGWATYGLNYTFSKALGIYTDQNAFDLASEYGPLNIDRTHMFNASYSVDLGTRVHGDFFGSRLVKGVANGWQLAGITQWQSGTPYQSMKGANLGFGTWIPIQNTYNYGGTGTNSGSRTFQMNNANMLGTTDVALQPYVKAGCDPTKGHGAHSVFNTDCWIVPNFMQNGPVWKGYFRAPGYFSSDLTMSKTFRVAEGKTVQFKASAFNFLNHPLQSFNGNDYSGNSDSLSVLNTPAVGWFVAGQQLQPTDFLYNTNGTDPNFVGKPHIKKGNRLVMLGLKFEF